MQIQWPFFMGAAILLLPALPLSASVRKYLHSRLNSTTSLGFLLRAWQNWVDLIRAGAGVYVLKEYAIHIDPAIKGAGTQALVVEGALLGIVLLFQVVRLAQGVLFVAPIFYLCGLTLVLAGYTTGGFAVFAGWLFAVGGRNLAFQLPAMGISLAAGGYLLDLSLPLLLNCCLIFLPLLMAFMFQKQLAFVASAPSVAQVVEPDS
jgi:hypothetical protein